MARLFITSREMDFISDITKEVMKDVVGERIFFYSISLIKSNVHELYEEAPDKVFDNPIMIDAIVDYHPNEVVTNTFGLESIRTIDVWIQSRDINDKGLVMSEGDFFTYGPNLFEVLSIIDQRNIYGQTEHTDGLKLSGRLARKGQFFTKVFGPTDEAYSDPDAVRSSFHQQRGVVENAEGLTGDVRTLQSNGVLDPPLSGPQSVLLTSGSNVNPKASFYDER